MPYVLGVDVGTSRTRAAVSRRTRAGWSDPVLFGLGAHAPGVPTVLYLAPDRSAVVGEDAERHAPGEPGRVARGFSRRIGDDVPLVLGGATCTPEELTAVLLRWVTDLVAGVEGGPAAQVVVTHPSGWGAHRRMLLHRELVRQGLPETTLVPEPIAVAEGHSRHDPGRFAPGDALAVLNVGAGVPEAAVVRRADSGRFELLANAEAAEELGGTHYDDALVEFVRGELGAAVTDLDPADPNTLSAMARLRGLCTEAKEMLSSEVEVSLPVRLPGTSADLRITRADLERMIRPAVAATVDLLPRTVAAAGAERLVGSVLVGGSAVVPLLGESVRAAARARLVAEPDPGAAVAIGAAVAARQIAAGPDAVAVPLASAEETTVFPRVDDPLPAGHPAALAALDLSGDGAVIEDDDAPPPRPPHDLTPLDLPDRSLLGRLLPGVKPVVVTVATIVLFAVGVALTFVFQQGSGGSQPASPFHAGGSQPTVNQTVPPPPAQLDTAAVPGH